MIFVTVGSREYQFNRLLIAIDQLVAEKIFTEEVFAQIGQSTYMPKNFKFTRFLDQSDFINYQKNSNMIISHAGTGALISALKLEKNVIAVPRLAEYNEHTDNHQLQIAKILNDEGYLRMVLNMSDLKEIYIESKINPITKKYDRPSNVYKAIIEFINL